MDVAITAAITPREMPVGNLPPQAWLSHAIFNPTKINQGPDGRGGDWLRKGKQCPQLTVHSNARFAAGTSPRTEALSATTKPTTTRRRSARSAEKPSGRTRTIISDVRERHADRLCQRPAFSGMILNGSNLPVGLRRASKIRPAHHGSPYACRRRVTDRNFAALARTRGQRNRALSLLFRMV
jgi:hypothetical protein